MKKRILSFALVCAMLVSMLTVIPMTVAADGEEATVEVVYDEVVTDDAYIRGNDSGNRNKNFNFEDVESGHNAPGVKVVNIKYQGGDINGNMNEIISLFKVSIPSKDEIERLGADKFEFQFTVFKNPNAYNCPETYEFYYIAESDMIAYLNEYGADDWTESTVKWNTGNIKWITSRYFDNLDAINDNKLEEVDARKIGSITIEKDEDYAGKVVKFDITDAVKALAEDGEEAITIFAYAKDDVKGDDGNGTSLMIHSRETEDESARPRLIGTKTIVTDPVTPPAGDDEPEYEFKDIDAKVNGFIEGDERAAQSTDMGKGVFWVDRDYWTGAKVTVTKNELVGNKATISFTHEGECTFGVQYFYNPEGTVNGNVYKVNLNVTSSVDTSITVNGTVYTLKAGEVTPIEYIVTADMDPDNDNFEYGTSVVSIQLGTKEPVQDIKDGEYTIEIASIALQTEKQTDSGTGTEPDPDNNPKTGDVAVLAVVAIVVSLAGAAVVVSKKRILSK